MLHLTALSLPDLLALHAEIAPHIQGARLQAIKQLESHYWVWIFYSNQSHALHWDFTRPRSLLWLTAQETQAQVPHAFTQRLRKHLLTRRLNRCEALEHDRVWCWTFDEQYQLWCEWSGHHSNFWLCHHEHILDACYPDRSARQLQPGQKYRLPSPAPNHTWPSPLQLNQLPADGSRSDTLAYWRQQSLLKTQRQNQLDSAHKQLTKQIRALEQQLEQCQQAINTLEQAEEYTLKAELLQGAYGKVLPGQSHVSVINYRDPHLSEVTLTLNPAQDLATQIQKLYQQARKRERAAERALLIWDPLHTRLQHLKLQHNQLQALTIEDIWSDIEQELIQNWQPLPQKAQYNTKRQAWHSFTASGGELIRVGRSARDNDQLRLQASRGHDLWFHVRDENGSHVIVSLNKGKSIHPESRLDAACLAQHFSQAKAECEIIYTPLKYVQRPSNAKPGQVILKQFESLWWRPEPERLARLLAQNRPSAPLEAESPVS